MSALACPFCSAFAVSEDLLQVHCLDLHPLEHLLAREGVAEELLARREAQATQEAPLGHKAPLEPPKPDSVQEAPPPDPDSPQNCAQSEPQTRPKPVPESQPKTEPLSPADSEDEELRIVDESPEHDLQIIDESPSPESSPASEVTDDLPQSSGLAGAKSSPTAERKSSKKKRRRSHSSSKSRRRSLSAKSSSRDRHSSRKRRRGEPSYSRLRSGSGGRRERAEGSREPIVWPDWAGSCSPDRSAPEAVTRLALLGRPAPRCHHNRCPCPDFPNCAGRNCPSLHPDCPGVQCEFRNACAFEHERYEKTCDICPGRRAQASVSALAVLCAHQRGVPCERAVVGRRCHRGHSCGFAHGLCPQGGACEAGERCYFEHAGRVYFCDACRGQARDFVLRPP